MNVVRISTLVLMALLLNACASNIPREISEPVSGAPNLSAVLANPKAFDNQPVRWGGTIARVENRKDETLVEIVARRLDAFGEPLPDDHSEGRFLARNPGFLDPQIYARDRAVTVFGTLRGTQNGKVGEQTLSYPLVDASKFYLWPKRRDWRDDPWCREAYWHAPIFYRYRYPGFWGYGPWGPPFGYPYGLWDPFWGPYSGPNDCRW